MYIPNQTEYNQLQAYARKVDYNTALDLVHDSILISTSFEDCLKKISGGKYYYSTCNIYPPEPKVISERQCKVCKEILPDCLFGSRMIAFKLYIFNTCKKCTYECNKEYWKKYNIQNKEKINKYRRKYNAKYRINNSEKIKKYRRKYRAENLDKIRTQQRIANVRYREKIKLQKLNQ
ncbi:hypothetical protein ACR79R_21555 [Sphingobacterium spiritivorum]|uniref:hypothetical protein n=1 Tax=Sphingobacterium spiritivorum TaxID=258 RepID=UPI003DA5D740